MEKDTKTFRCDGCGKTVVLDFYEGTPAKLAQFEKELHGWVTLELSATRRAGLPPLIAPIVGHACTDACVEKAFGAIVHRRLPEQVRQKT